MTRLISILCAATLFSFPLAAETILVEAEGFRDRGGWQIDQQSMDRMGSPYLLAHGLGRPVLDAVTTVEFKRSGTFSIHVRTRNWVAPWTGEQADPEAPGRFRIVFDGKEIETVFGDVRTDWHWQKGGTITIDRPGRHELRLRDLTGFDGRCDAILFSDDPEFVPSDLADEFDPLRRKLLGLTADPLQAPSAEKGPFDLVVCGGGVAGVNAAVFAARSGIKVALVQDRPVLGGNSSGEIRVPIAGRSNYPEYPNLGNLTFEVFEKHPGDQERIRLVQSVPNLTLYLSTHIFAVEKRGSRITAVIGKNIETNRELRFEARFFADCTGDGTVGVLAGNPWRTGRESKAETGEELAPEKSDQQVMGASAQWSTRETTKKTTYPRLPWAVRFTDRTIRPALDGGWNWEVGYHRDQVAEIERIRDQGLRAAYGHWSYMKNEIADPEWQEKVARRELAWLACIIGKRESRRLLGDHLLCEQDIINRKKYPDAFVPFVWHIDLHYPHPENSKHFPGEEFRAAAVEKRIFAYAIPYRCLYARDIDNLFMAGRCVSVTHVGLGPIRVQRTTGMMGEVVGAAASICVRRSSSPRGVYRDHLEELKALVRKGAAPKPERIPDAAQPRPWSDRGEMDLMEKGLQQVLSSPY